MTDFSDYLLNIFDTIRTAWCFFSLGAIRMRSCNVKLILPSGRNSKIWLKMTPHIDFGDSINNSRIEFFYSYIPEITFECLWWLNRWSNIFLSLPCNNYHNLKKNRVHQYKVSRSDEVGNLFCENRWIRKKRFLFSAILIQNWISVWLFWNSWQMVCRVCFFFISIWMVSEWQCENLVEHASRSTWFRKYVIFSRTDFPLQGFSSYESHQPRSEKNFKFVFHKQKFRSKKRKRKKSRSEIHDIFSNSKLFSLFLRRLLF